MKQFESDKEMLKELDDFIYKSKSLQGSFLRDELMYNISVFLKEHELNKNQHDFVDHGTKDKI